MAQLGITFLEVKQAIAELQKQEKSITVDNIRELLGAGSRSRINIHLATWRQQADHHTALTDTTPPNKLINLITSLWRSMRSKANNITAQRQTTCNAEITQTEQQQAEPPSEKQIKDTITLLQQETYKLAEKLYSLEEERQDSLDENQKLHAYINHLRRTLKHHQHSTQQQYEEQAFEIVRQHNAFKEKETELKKEIEALNKINAQLEASNHSLQKRVNSIQKQQASIYKVL